MMEKKILCQTLIGLKTMKNKLFIILTAVFLGACASPKFIVTSKEYTPLADYCSFEIMPINKQALKINWLDGIFSECGKYDVGDTIKLNRKEFTNY